MLASASVDAEDAGGTGPWGKGRKHREGGVRGGRLEVAGTQSCSSGGRAPHLVPGPDLHADLDSYQLCMLEGILSPSASVSSSGGAKRDLQSASQLCHLRHLVSGLLPEKTSGQKLLSFPGHVATHNKAFMSQFPSQQVWPCG